MNHPIANNAQPALRQMVYLVIKELAKVAEDVLMVTSSIMKDMQPNLEVIYRPNAIRAVCRVIDVRGREPSLANAARRARAMGADAN